MTKKNRPVSKALAGAEITLDARLASGWQHSSSVLSLEHADQRKSNFRFVIVELVVTKPNSHFARPAMRPCVIGNGDEFDFLSDGKSLRTHVCLLFGNLTNPVRDTSNYLHPA